MVSWVLKEWQVAVAALLRGETVLLLRKGGIREAGGQFSLAAREVLLLPTVEHQQPELLKPAFQPLLATAAAAPDPVPFEGWATITHATLLGAETDIASLLPHLVWNQRFVAERLAWQPDRPLYALLLRAYRFQTPLLLPRHRGYGGCRSWVELDNAIALPLSTPALADADYRAQIAPILAQLGWASEV